MNTYQIKAPLQALVVLLLLLSCQHSKAQVCPQGFSSHFSRCLLINLTASVSWCDANRACVERGAELVTNWNVIQNLINIINNANAWIGVSDMASERDTSKEGWQFVNGRGIMPNSVPLWIDGDPNNGGGGIQDCVRTNYDSPNYDMIDKNCDDLSGYVCEIPDVPLTTTQCGGPIGVGGGGSSGGGGRIRWIPAPIPTSTVSNLPTRYCYWQRSSVSSLRDCAMLAGARAFSRSFLYNKNTKVCHVTEFSDSQTPLEQPPTQTQWVKFLKG